MSLTIWTNMQLRADEIGWLRERVRPHTLLVAESQISNLTAGQADEDCRAADIIVGQPAVEDLLASKRVQWVHLTSAGYTRYDRPDVREAFKRRDATLTNSSRVYADPCAHQVLAFMLEHCRSLTRAAEWQAKREWSFSDMRPRQRVLTGQSAVIVGYGAIGRRLVELLEPFQMKVKAIRRRIKVDETHPPAAEVESMADRILEMLMPFDMKAILQTATGAPAVPTFSVDDIAQHLGDADHVINLLPSSPSTRGLFNAQLFSLFKPGAAFYNVGRGDTVDQASLIDALGSGKVAAAYLDVTHPEPPASDDPLWTTPNLTVTPHVAGGVQDESQRLMDHFLENLRRRSEGEAFQDLVF